MGGGRHRQHARHRPGEARDRDRHSALEEITPPRLRAVVALAAAGLALAAAGLALAACSTSVDVPVHHAGTPDATLPAGLPSVVASATPFTLPPAPSAGVVAGLRLTPLDSAAARPTTIADLRGARATVVAFWATWCAPCQAEVPQLQQREASLRSQGVRLLLVDEGEDAAAVSSWLRTRSVAAGAVWLDEGTSAHDAMGLVGLPATALLAPDGGVSDRIEGSTQVGPLDADLAALGISAQ